MRHGNAALLVVFLIVAACAPAQEISLPPPSHDGDASVADAIQSRRSVRRFENVGVTAGVIGQLLWAAAGVTIDGVSGPTRAAASAGGLYPVEAYLVAGEVRGIEAGVYRYLPEPHALDRVTPGDLRRRLQRAALNQAAVGRAPAVVVVAADFSVTERRYGERGAERYVYMDAGHAAQNVLLQATALDLGAVPIGAFDDEAVREVLSIQTEPLYLIPLGRPDG
jgi:SagB-type dehydrogenase family enzyme